MTETFILSSPAFSYYRFHVMCGMLHDETVSAVKVTDRELTFSFDSFRLFEEDFFDKTWYEQFKNYQKCQMTVRFSPAEYKGENVVILSAVKKEKNGRGTIAYQESALATFDFSAYRLQFLNPCLSDTFSLECSVFSGKTPYDNLRITLLAEEITFVWE